MNAGKGTPSTQNHDRKGVGLGAYLLTFACYGARLPGQAGSVDRVQNQYGGRLPEADPGMERAAKRCMRQPAYLLDRDRRRIVLQSVRETCWHRSWTLLAAHVRTNHVHIVIEADGPAEQVLSTLKAHASRALNQAGLDGAGRRRWARHGSTRHLWAKQAVTAAVCYVVSGQGEPMELWEHISGNTQASG